MTDEQRLQDWFGDEWEEMDKQAALIASLTGISYSEAVDHMIRREQQTTAGQFKLLGKAWDEAVTELVKTWNQLVESINRRHQ